MTFEEDFPSFNDEVERWVNDEAYIDTIKKRLKLLCIDKQKVKEVIELNQELIKSLATRKRIENNPLIKKVRDKIKELGLE